MIRTPKPVARWIKEQACFVAVLAAMAAGFAYLIIGSGHWVRSTAVMGGALLLAAALRLFVPPARVGMLEVRARWIDVVMYAAAGALIVGLDLRLHR